VIEHLVRFRRAQQAMYAGGDVGEVASLMAEDVVWHVPGRSAIAGDHRGRDAVIAYFELRRGLAGGTLRIAPVRAIDHGDTVAEFADGAAVLGGVETHWSTVGVYRFRDGLVAEAWLVPLDLEAFDAAWRLA
jgi:ketosteroid isomerase-like protein